MRRNPGKHLLCICLASLLIAVVASPVPDFLSIFLLWMTVLLMGLFLGGAVWLLRKHSGNGK